MLLQENEDNEGATSLSTNISSQVSSLLDENKFSEALGLFKEEEQLNNIKDDLFDVIPMLSSRLTLENATSNQELFSCCEKMLEIIAQTCKPSEVVLGLLEQMEDQDTDVRFCALLKPLAVSLNNMDSNKARVIEWCISTIKSYINCLPIPKNQQESQELEESTEKYLKVNAVVNRVIEVYEATLNFLESSVPGQTDLNTELNKNLLSVFLFMLGSPLCYIPDNHWEELTIASLPERIIKNILVCSNDCLTLFNVIEQRSKGFNKRLNEKGDILESEEHVPNLAYANFFYYIFSTDVFRQEIAQIYHPHYILHNCLYLANCMINDADYVLISKGLNFIKCVIARIDKYSLDPKFLEFPIHTEILNGITRIMIFCELKKSRTLALQVFRNYIDILAPRTRYLTVLHLYKTATYPGLLSLVTSIFKSSIVECLEKGPCHDEFLGESMKVLLKHACKLPHGSSSDIIELSDAIVTALNLLRFLAIRDKDNKTGFWDYIQEIKEEYLKPLRQAVDMSRGYWKVKIIDLEEQKRNKKEGRKIDDNMTITVAGETVPMFKISEKIEFCHRALNAIDVIESILIRVNECL